MPNYSPTRSYESILYPGVTITLRKTNEKRRAELMRELAPHLEEERALTKRFAELQDRAELVFDGVDENGKPKPKMDPVSCEQVKEFKPDDLVIAADILQERDSFKTLTLYPIYIKKFVVSIDGLTIDDRKAEISDLLGDDAPDGLAEEIINVLENKIDLSVSQKKISQSDSTTDEAEPPTNLPTNAPIVRISELFPEETAQSTSQS